MYQALGRRLLPGMTSFADVVRARWHSLAEPDDPTSRLRYDAMREHFERRHGRIIAAHWSSREAAGVAICPEFSPLLRHVAGEAARASSSLSGRAQRLAVTDLFTRSRHVMAALET
jgi:hypothetical protein